MLNQYMKLKEGKKLDKEKEEKYGMGRDNWITGHCRNEPGAPRATVKMTREQKNPDGAKQAYWITTGLRQIWVYIQTSSDT